MSIYAKIVKGRDCLHLRFDKKPTDGDWRKVSYGAKPTIDPKTERMVETPKVRPASVLMVYTKEPLPPPSMSVEDKVDILWDAHQASR